MQPLLETFLHEVIPHDEGMVQQLAKELNVATYPKGTILVAQGDIADRCFFVLKGCVRAYALDAEGNERTQDFFTERQTVVNLISYKRHTPSECAFVCMEPCTLIVGDRVSEKQFYQQHPGLSDITRSLMEDTFGAMQEASALFKASTPEQRYIHLMEQRPELLERVPKHQLASYLGMTPESLSRIKRRVESDSLSDDKP